MNAYFSLAALVALSIGLGCSSPPRATPNNHGNPTGSRSVMLDLSNADVTWDATYDGYAPHVSDRATAALKADEETISALLGLLSDPDKFVVAHVALTQLAHLSYAVSPTWNGLEVQLKADGRTIIDPEQRHELARRWQSWHAASPRPRTLP